MKIQQNYDKDHEKAARIPIENYDDPMLVSVEDYDYLSQFKWYKHHLSGGEVVTYVDIPYVGTRMVFAPWLVLTRAGRTSWGPEHVPIHGTNAKSTRINNAFISKENFEKFARRR